MLSVASAATMENRILYVTYDKPSFVTRSGALVQSGYRVSSPRRAEDAIAMAASSEYLAVVIGSSVLRVDRVHVIRGIRKMRPNQPILYFSEVSGDIEPEADDSIDVSQDFGRLLSALHALDGEADGEEDSEA
jgi:DNA-binding response OmpR family regulator